MGTFAGRCPLDDLLPCGVGEADLQLQRDTAGKYSLGPHIFPFRAAGSARNRCSQVLGQEASGIGQALPIDAVAKVGADVPFDRNP